MKGRTLKTRYPLPPAMVAGYPLARATEIRQHVTVEAGGRVAIQSTELLEGESSEVIVIVERRMPTTAQQRLAALQELRRKINLTSKTAADWESELRAERDAWRDPAAS